jgi:hypothetical protein
MTDEEWRVFRVNRLMYHNIFISDSERKLYDAPMDGPDSQGVPLREAMAKSSIPLLPPRHEAPRTPREVVTKPQPEVDISQFIRRDT